jgi:hypothetical protein
MTVTNAVKGSMHARDGNVDWLRDCAMNQFDWTSTRLLVGYSF